MKTELSRCEERHPRLAAKKYDSSTVPKVGRPGHAADVRELVLELARGNPGWGYTRIRDTLRGLKIEIGRTTVATMLAKAGIEPAPERNRKRSWAHFLKSHWETLYACDFFSVETLGVFGTVRYMVFFVIELKSRAVQTTRRSAWSDAGRASADCSATTAARPHEAQRQLFRTPRGRRPALVRSGPWYI